MADPFAQYAISAAAADPDPFAAYATSSEDDASEGAVDPTPPTGSAIGRYFSNAWDQLNPVTLVEGAAQAVAHPIETAKALVGAQVAQGKQAMDLARQGRYTEALGHAGAAALPLLGPAAARVGEQIGSGDVAGGLGSLTGLVAPLVAGAVAPESATVPGVFAPADADAGAAVGLADAAGVPLDAATASGGNRFLKAAQHLADRTLGGSLVSEKADVARHAGLATLGEQLASKGYAMPVTAEQAGDAVRAGVLDQVTGNAQLANDAYDRLRQIEANPAHARVVPGADGSTQLMPLPVALTSAQKILTPIYDELIRQRDLAPASMMGDKARALQALDTLVHGPAYAPLSTVDSVLGDLKAFTRSGAAADVPELATKGQGAVKMAVGQLQDAVDATAQSAGPDAVAALKEGRHFTVAKYQAADVLDSLNAEPVKTLNSLLAPGDSAIEKLRAVATQAPDTLPQIGRANLDRLMALAPDKAFAEWNKLGAATKQTLYQDPQLVSDLDRFFRLGKLSASTPNPSGTAHTIATMTQGGMMISAPWMGTAVQLAGAGLSKLLHSSAGVRLLTKGFDIPIGNRAAGAAWLATLTNLANAATTSPSGSQTQNTALGPVAGSAR